MPAQLTAGGQGRCSSPRCPSVGFAVFDVQPAEAPGGKPPPRRRSNVTASSLENARYRVTLDANGDVAQHLRQGAQQGTAVGAGPSGDQDRQPAQLAGVEHGLGGPDAARRAPTCRGRRRSAIVENGPARVALEIARETEGSTFVQTIRLSAGDAGNRVEFANAIDWKTKEAHLKAVFPLTASNPMATYNWDVGTIERPTNDERQFEVRVAPVVRPDRQGRRRSA